MRGQRTIREAGIREAYIVSWRIGNGPYHSEAFETEAGANAFIQRHRVRGRIHLGVVMDGLFPSDIERASIMEITEAGASQTEETEERQAE